MLRDLESMSNERVYFGGTWIFTQEKRKVREGGPSIAGLSFGIRIGLVLFGS